MSTGTGSPVYWNWHTCLLELAHLSAGTVTPVYWNWHTCLLELSHLSIGTGTPVCWNRHTCLLELAHLSAQTAHLSAETGPLIFWCWPVCHLGLATVSITTQVDNMWQVALPWSSLPTSLFMPPDRQGLPVGPEPLPSCWGRTPPLSLIKVPPVTECWLCYWSVCCHGL